ncbi:MAG: NAD-dependent epimerase/dehydratase family protein [Lacisediminihabitans sp.]
MRVVVVGASGFVGTAARRALESRGCEVVSLSAPRLPAMSVRAVNGFIESAGVIRERLAQEFRDSDAVVNAAGCPDASSRNTTGMIAANGALPGLLAAAARDAAVSRFVHVSSAVVQGRLPVLDETEASDAFSPYARAKLLGEQMARRFGRDGVVVYRPPSVHSTDRRVTKMTARIGASPLGSVARPATSPSPQALIANVADAIAFLTMTTEQPPSIVIHPWEGLTTADVMTLLGGRRPITLPRALAQAVVTSLNAAGSAVPALAPNARRIEMLWFGQRQAVSWLTTTGWSGPAGREQWELLGREVRAQRART